VVSQVPFQPRPNAMPENMAGSSIMHGGRDTLGGGGGGFGNVLDALAARSPTLTNAMTLMSGSQMAALGGSPDFRQAVFDWRQDRPDREGLEREAFRQAMMDWRMGRPTRANHVPGQPQPGPGNGNGHPQGLPTPVGAPQAVGLNNFPNMTGSSLYVQGMTPGATAYDLPTY
jgi:hypothetical protein